MRLYTFISENHEAIFKEWIDFAATLAPALQAQNHAEMAGHLKQILETIETDLARSETASEKSEKSKGLLSFPIEASAASTHGTSRFTSSFSLNSTIAEYRALRATVTRLWLDELNNKPEPDTASEDLIRFNESIDQALSESVASFAIAKEQQTRAFNTILSTSPDLGFTFDLNGRFAYANHALTELLGLPLNKIVEKKFVDLDLPSAAELESNIQFVISSKELRRGEFPYITTSGQELFYEYICAPVLNNNGTLEAVACIARNITDRKAVEDSNWKKANYDALTGLPNRSLFNDRLEQNMNLAGRTGKPFALMFIDLDDFKEANDMYGHDAGDLLLQLAANRIHGCVRETDTVARLGGDEFTVILPDVKDAEQVEIVAGNIIKELASPFNISNNAIQISASIGIAHSSKNGGVSENIIKNADRAMYAAKKAGRNRFCYFDPREIAPSTPTWQRKVSRRNTRSDVINRRNEDTDDRRGGT